MRSTVKYTSWGAETAEIPLGKDYSLRRQPGDFVLRRAIASDLPLYVAIVITPDGWWRWWYTEARGEEIANPYWHFANGGTPAAPTESQRETLLQMQHGELSPLGLDGALGSPVIAWAFGEVTARIAASYHG